jgi:hypothetical protein
MLQQFWAPMREEFNKEHFIINIIGALGIIPSGWIGRELDNLWISWGVFFLWWALVVLIYLTYRYLKNK